MRQRFGLPVMKALPIAERADLAAIRLYDDVADRLLFDARAAARGDAAGRARQDASTGGCCAISTRACRSCSRAGSTPAMSREALRITRAPGVDVSSGVERAPGEKDPDKIRAFIARRARGGRAADRAAEESRVAHDHPAAAIPSAPGPTSAGISASMAAASSPRR